MNDKYLCFFLSLFSGELVDALCVVPCEPIWTFCNKHLPAKTRHYCILLRSDTAHLKKQALILARDNKDNDMADSKIIRNILEAINKQPVCCLRQLNVLYLLLKVRL